jgi:hypothetical protein
MLLDKIAHIHICGISVRKYYTIINWYDSNIASLLFLETPTIAQKRRREQWLLSMGTINLLLPEYSVNICFIIAYETNLLAIFVVVICGFREFTVVKKL